MANMIRRAAHRLSFGVEKYMPHSFIFLAFLTVITYLLALLLTPSGPFDIITEWYGEFWGFLEFTMQMTLIIVLGYGIASAPRARQLLLTAATSPSSSVQAYLSVVLLAAGLSYLNWGMGLVGGTFFAIALAEARDDVDFGYATAITYVGFLTGSVGSLSITAPLLVNTPGHFVEDQIGLIPLSETIFSPLHLTGVISILVVVLLVVYLMRPPSEEVDSLSSAELDELLPKYGAAASDENPQSLAQRANTNPIFTAIFVLMGGSFIIFLAVFEGLIQVLELNSVNFILLVAGLALHEQPMSYVNAIGDGVERTAQVILQFPFYGGIQGILTGTGLTVIAVEAFANFATATTFPFLVFLVTGILNVFVPSAGGQYIVTAEILHETGEGLDVAHPVIVSSYTFGDMWTNMLQPFWALPVIGIAGLEIRDIWGYVLVGFVGFGLAAGIVLLAFPIFGLV